MGTPADVAIIDEQCDILNDEGYDGTTGSYTPPSGFSFNTDASEDYKDYGFAGYGYDKYSSYTNTSGSHSFSMNASSTITEGSSWDGWGGDTELEYEISGLFLTVNLVGATTVNGRQCIMVGDALSASLNGQWLQSDAEQNFSYVANWTISGNTENSYDVVRGIAGVKNPVPYTCSGRSAYVVWYDHTSTTETVQCDVTVTPDPGTGLAPFKVTIKKPIRVEYPATTAKATPGDGVVQQNQVTVNGGTTSYWYVEAVGLSGGQTKGGMESHVTITSPGDFANEGAGSYNLLQIISPGEYIKRYPANTLISGKYNGQTGVDEDANSNFWYQTSPDRPPVVSADGLTSEIYWIDSPGINVSLEGADYAKLTSSFVDYLMWQPPNGVWVPLKKMSWSTTLEATEPVNSSKVPTGWQNANGGTVNLLSNYSTTTDLPVASTVIPYGESFPAPQ